MQAINKNFLQFLEGVDKRFSIPVFQRNYDWQREHCEQLFNDLLDIIKFNFRSHFLGSLVYVFDESKPGFELLIIDGQQRIATLSILLLALHNLLENNEIQSRSESLSEQIRDTYLIDKYAQEGKKIKFEPVKEDNEAYLKLFKNNSEEFIKNSNITINYQYFVDRIKRSNLLADDLFEAIKKLTIVDIRLDSNHDDPQLIFESLNSTGLNLTQSDLVRNFILMGKNKSEQKRLHEDHWLIIEKNTGDQVDSFVRDYLTLKERIIPNKNKIYISFKKHVKKEYSNDDIESLLKELKRYSQYYQRIIFPLDDKSKINVVLKRINKLDITVSYPFLLEVFSYHDDKVIDDETLVNILDTIVSFAFRRLICNVPTNALNKMFATIGRDIQKYPDFKVNYFEIFKHILINKKYSQRFPTDEEFSEILVTRDIYNLQSKNKLHLLERLENYDNKERVKVEELLNEGDLNIEHIMPQTLTPSWKAALGDNWDEIYNKYLNTLGNLTLTGYNTKMSNKPFLEKRDMEKGYEDSSLALNKYLRTLENWNEETIIERANQLTSTALKIWTYPKTEYKGQIEESNKFILSDDHDFTGDKIASFTLLGQDFSVNSWRDFYIKLAQNLIEINPNIFADFLKDKRFIEERKIISAQAESLSNPFEIAEGIFLETHLSAQSIVNNALLILSKYEIDEDGVAVILSNKNSQELADFQKKRIKFWGGLLEINKDRIKYFKKNTSFIHYDLYSGTGITRCSYFYRIKQKSGTVGLSIDTYDKEKNEHIYNKLLEKKNEIENAFGEKLEWFDGEKTQFKSIYKEYKYTGLKNEDKWPALQQDMADGMARFTEILDEYLAEFK